MQFTGFPIRYVAIGAAIAVVVATVLYLLQLRKRRIEVPFTGLWQKVVEEQARESSLWRRLRRILSWLLHVLIIALLAFGVLDPHFEDEVVDKRHIVVLVDNSASMAADDVAGATNRLEKARKRALELLGTVGGRDRVMLATFNDQVRPRSPFVGDPGVLESRIRDLEVTGTGTNFRKALRFAADALEGAKRSELVVFGDGAGYQERDLEDVQLDDDVTVRHVQVGEGGGNVAITGFAVRRYVANKLDYELFVQVHNYFDRTIEVDLEIHADDRLVDTKRLRLEAGETRRRFYPKQAVSGERLEARLDVVTTDARDVFELDDRAYALLPKLETVDVQLVSDKNLYLEGALLLNPNVEVTRVDPDAYEPASAANFDVTVFDGPTPPPPETGNALYINPTGEDSPWPVTGEVDEPLITDVLGSHPLMQWITLKDLNIESARKLTLQRGDTRVASALGHPLIVARDEPNRKLVGIAFDVRASDLPLRVAFPMLMFNVVDFFKLDDASFVPNFKTGETWSIDLPEGTKSAQVHPPEGEPYRATVFEGRAVFRGLHPGFYRVETGGEPARLAANLADAEESAIEPSDLELGDGERTASAEALFFDRSQLWIWAAIAAALLLLLEWFTYNRRTTV